MEELPFGYSQRQKRSHAQMEGPQRSASPGWSTYHCPGNPGPNAVLNPPFHPSLSSLTVFPDFTPPPPRYGDNLYGGNQYSFGYDDRPQPRNLTPQGLPLYDHNSLPYLEDPHFASSSAQHPQDPARTHFAHDQDMAALAPPRYPGDGFDYRRPIGAAREQDVDLAEEEEDIAVDLSREDDDEVIIDLTADDSGYGASQEGPSAGTQGNARESRQSDRTHRFNNAPPRLPRGMDIIIDLDNGEEEWSLATPPPPPEPGSPEIEFISSRRIDPPYRAPSHLRPGSLEEDGEARENDEQDEVEFVRAVPLPAAEARRRRTAEIDHVMDLLGTMNGSFTHLRAQVDRFNAQVHRTATSFRLREGLRRNGRGGNGAPRLRSPVALGRNVFVAPALNFEMVGFDLGMPGGRPQEPAAPTYDAPEKAPEGFTRSPEEKDVLICPNCGDELCTGGDDVKKQVWLVKACGHVYCGECTANRSAKRTAKGKERPPRTKPFKDCQVEDCGRSVAHRKTMIQVYL